MKLRKCEVDKLSKIISDIENEEVECYDGCMDLFEYTRHLLKIHNIR